MKSPPCREAVGISTTKITTFHFEIWLCRSCHTQDLMSSNSFCHNFHCFKAKQGAPTASSPTCPKSAIGCETLTLQRLRDFFALSTTAQGILPCGRRAKSSKAMRVPCDASLSSSTCQQICFFFLVQMSFYLCFDAMKSNQNTRGQGDF